jgi:hypothetical protein
MKEIKAIIKPFRLEEVIHALHQIKDLPAMTVSTAHGLSAEHGAFDLVVKTKLEIMVPDERAQPIFIAGIFNEWNATVTPMVVLGEGRSVKGLSLPPGRYECCLVVDGEWRSDPAATGQTPNVEA